MYPHRIIVEITASFTEVHIKSGKLCFFVLEITTSFLQYTCLLLNNRKYTVIVVIMLHAASKAARRVDSRQKAHMVNINPDEQLLHNVRAV